MTDASDPAHVALPDPVLARPDETAAPGLPPGRVPDRTVIAAVRPFDQNLKVIATAAEIAIAQDAQLLVLGIIPRVVSDWVNPVPSDVHVLEAAHGELFADCVELLYESELVWGVQVRIGHVVSEINEIGRRLDLRAVVSGEGRTNSRFGQLIRRFCGDLSTRVSCPHTSVGPWR